MLAEWLMHKLDFDAIWYAHPGKWRFFYPGKWYAGVWTGPDSDLICVKTCASVDKAEELLSPGSHTILGAIVKATLIRRHPSLSTFLRGER